MSYIYKPIVKVFTRNTGTAPGPISTQFMQANLSIIMWLAPSDVDVEKILASSFTLA